MATTHGRVVRLTWQAEMLCIYVGASMSNAALFNLQFLDSDTNLMTEHKRLLSKLLTAALVGRRTIDLLHDDLGRVSGIDFPAGNIAPVGPAIHNDFYSIAGSAIPPDAEIVFETTTQT